jgi:hypothetical protein
MSAETQLVATIQRLQVQKTAIEERLTKARQALLTHAPFKVGDKIAISQRDGSPYEPVAPMAGNYTITSVIPHVPDNWEKPHYWEVKMRGAGRTGTYELYRRHDEWRFGPDHAYEIVGNINTETAA